jgi:hypothetical protein
MSTSTQSAPPQVPTINTVSGTTTVVISDSTPTVIGECEIGSTVEVDVVHAPDQSITLGNAQCSAAGTYSVTPTVNLIDNTYNFTAKAAYPNGDTSANSSTTTITIDSVRPDEPVVTTPANGAVLAGATLMIVGTGEIGAVVNVTDGGGHGCSTVVDEGENWTCSITSEFSDGNYIFSVTQTDTAGNTSSPVTTVSFVIDATAPAILSAPNVLGEPISISNMLNVSGQCVNGDVITAYTNSTAVATTYVCSDSVYVIAPSEQLLDGVYDITVTATDAVGNASSPSQSVRITFIHNTRRADVNNDNHTDVQDAVLILRRVIGLSVSDWATGQYVGDTNCDGTASVTRVSVIDALLALRYSVGLDMNTTQWCAIN